METPPLVYGAVVMASPLIYSFVCNPNSRRVNFISQMGKPRLPEHVQGAAQACSLPVKWVAAVDHTHVLPISSSHP